MRLLLQSLSMHNTKFVFPRSLQCLSNPYVRPLQGKRSDKTGNIISRSLRRISTADQTYENAPSHAQTVKPFQSIPGPSGMPILGTLAQYRLGPFSVINYHKALLERYQQYGDIFKETISGDTIVHLLHPEYIKAMYATEGKIPHIPPLLETTQMYRKYRDMSPGLGNTNGDEWYRLRTNINQMMMRPKAVTMYLPSVNAVADDFIARLTQVLDPGTGEVQGFNNEILKWTLESSAMTCFEKRLGCFEAAEDSFPQQMINASQTIFALSLKLRFSVPWYKLRPQMSPTWRKLIAAEDFFFKNGQKFVDETVGKIEALMEEGGLGADSYGFLTYLLGKPDLTYKDLSIIALSLFADGLSTTSPTMVGQLYCLASNAEAQERLYEEVSRLAPDPHQPITSAMINQASYLKACIKEGFRFFPIGTEVSRIPQNDIVIGGYMIPAGTHVELNNNLLLQLPEYFEQPERYLPERWLRGGSGHNIHPYLLLPFGFGPRTCAAFEVLERYLPEHRLRSGSGHSINTYLLVPCGYGPRTCAGQRFAQQEMTVLMFKLLQRFRLEWPHRERMGQVYNMLLKPDMEARIRFRPRH